MKAERRAQRKVEKAEAAETAPETDEDPDIAGVVAGPQPHPWMDDVDDLEAGHE